MPRNWPFLGILPSLLLHLYRLHDACAEILEIIWNLSRGTTYLLKLPWFLNMDILGTVDPEDVHHIMSANFANYPKGPEFKRIFEVLGDGIFTSDSDSWKQQRKVARLLINHQKFQKFVVKISWDKVEQGLIPVLEHAAENGLVVDLQDVFQRLTFDTTCKLVTGYDPGCLAMDFPSVEFSKAMDEVEEAIVYRYVLPESLLKLLKNLGIGKVSKAYATLESLVSEYVSMKQEEVKRGKKHEVDHEGFDLLTSYINGDEAMGLTKCDDKFLRDTILNFMIAGRDTTSSALTWFLWLVSTHPAVQKKIREELKAATPATQAENFRLFKSDELRNLAYLHAALCETMRLYPPVPFQHKTPLKPDILPSGHHVHPKMKVMFSLYAMGRMESVWGKDCKEFKPERWISESGKVRHEPSYKFLAFNAGPRTCLGKDVAFTQMKAVAAAMLHNYHVQVEKDQPLVPNVSVILYMKQGLKVTVSKRWK